jgi:hypothetical protein
VQSCHGTWKFLIAPSVIQSGCFYFMLLSDFFKIPAKLLIFGSEETKHQNCCLVITCSSSSGKWFVDILLVMPLADMKFCLCAD